MLKTNVFRAGLVAAALAAWPLLATAQDNQQTGSSQQGSSATQQSPQGQAAQGQQVQSSNPGQAQEGFGQGQGQAADARQQALSHLTAARQSLADMTKLPAASHLEGQARNEINQLITNFNALITSTGPDWRQAYDKVQDNLRTLLGADNAGQPGEAPVGTSGSAAGVLDASIRAKLSDVRQQVNEFGQIAGLKPGESASAQASSSENASSQPTSASTGTTGNSTAVGTSGASNEQALRSVDQINAILSRVLAQPSMSPNQDSVTVSRQDLQQMQQYLNQLRQSLGGAGR
ncbi:MAG: hypothetical protein ACM3NQ_20960 [Bacteroidales bacterium]